VFNQRSLRRSFGDQESKEVLVVGTRSTASLAYHLWFGLTKLDIRTVRITSITTETFDYVNKLDHHSLMILIGFPRYLAELMSLLHFAQKKGIRTVTITDAPFSQLLGEMNLYADGVGILCGLSLRAPGLDQCGD
jgi:DNA-binding MurR/RpiR family transcriptional regulator